MYFADLCILFYQESGLLKESIRFGSACKRANPLCGQNACGSKDVAERLARPFPRETVANQFLVVLIF